MIDPDNKEVKFTLRELDAIYFAWHRAGVDISGGNWKKFVSRLDILEDSPEDSSEPLKESHTKGMACLTMGDVVRSHVEEYKQIEKAVDSGFAVGVGTKNGLKWLGLNEKSSENYQAANTYLAAIAILSRL
jgi:hypothetical protein